MNVDGGDLLGTADLDSSRRSSAASVSSLVRTLRPAAVAAGGRDEVEERLDIGDSGCAAADGYMEAVAAADGGG